MGARGEIRLAAGEHQVVVLYTNRALAEAEAATGRSVMQIVNAMNAKDVPMGTLAGLVQAGLTAARRDAGGPGPCTLDEAYAILDEVGYAPALLGVAEALAAVLAWKAEAPGGPVPPAGPARGTPGADGTGPIS